MVCKKCGKWFPRKIKIEEKERNLRNRKFCLECSPFLCHNTVDLSIIEVKMDTIGRECECTVCGRHYIYSKTSGHTLTLCNSCSVNRYKKDLKLRMVTYCGGKCLVCGYSRCLDALDFHHVDESTKLFDISGSHCRAWLVIKEELDKCVLLCSNCHRELHAGFVTVH